VYVDSKAHSRWEGNIRISIKMKPAEVDSLRYPRVT